VFKSLGNHSKRKRLNLGLGLVSGGSVSEYTRKIGHLADPPAVFLPLEFHTERHAASCRLDSTGSSNPMKVRRTLAISGEAAIWTGLVSCISLFGDVARPLETVLQRSTERAVSM
jgi:hypothetical protein